MYDLSGTNTQISFYRDRNQVMFPLLFSRLIGNVDVEAIVYEGGCASQAGAVR